MTRKRNNTEKAIEIANGDPIAIEDEVIKTISELAKRHPTLGIAIAYTIHVEGEEGEAQWAKGAGLVGMANPHSMLHAIEKLGKNAEATLREQDPEGVESFFEEVRARQSLEQLATILGAALGDPCTACGHAKEDHDSDEGIGPCHHGEGSGNVCACLQYRNGEE